MRSTEISSLLGSAPDVGEGLYAAFVAHHRAIEFREIRLREGAERKAFFAAGFVLEPGIRYGAELIDVLADFGLWNDLEAQALLLRASVRIAKIVRLLAGEGEARKIDARDLRDLQHGVSHVDIGRQVIGTDGVVDGAAAGLVRKFAKAAR